MLASTAEKATWCVRYFCLVKSSNENSTMDVHTFILVVVLQSTKAGGEWQEASKKVWE